MFVSGGIALNWLDQLQRERCRRDKGLKWAGTDWLDKWFALDEWVVRVNAEVLGLGGGISKIP